MELGISGNVAVRLPSLDDIEDVAGNLTANLTRLAADIANYSLNYLDVGVMSTTTATTNSITTTAMPHILAEAAYAIMANTSLNFNIANANVNLNANAAVASAINPPIDDNAIRLEHAPQFSKSAMVKAYVLSVMALLSLLGNVLTMWNIYKTRIARRNSRHSWSAIYSLIFHLSIADVLVTGFCIMGEAIWYYTVEWLADELTCKLVKTFQMFSLYLSTYVLVLIGVDRWIAVKYPMKSLNMAKRCYRLLGGTYILSFLLSLPQFFIFHVSRGPFIEEFHQCVTHGTYTAEWQEQLYNTFTLVFTFLLPLCILFGTYMSTFCTISSSEKMFQGSKLATYSSKPSTQTNRQRLIHKAKMKSLRISVVIIIAFLICWTPYNVMMLIFTFWNPDKRFEEDLQSGIFFFGMSNSLVNPLIYGAFHLCPMKRKSKNSNNNNGTYSLNRGDSQRTPSMLTAVTQIDATGRQIRTYRQQSYYRSASNGSSYKEHVSLLQVTPTATLLRKSNSMRSPQMVGHHHHPHHHQLQPHQPVHQLQTTQLIGNGIPDIGPSTHSTVVLSYDKHAVNSTNCSGGSSGNGGVVLANKHIGTGSAMPLHGLVEDVSTV